MRFLAAARDGLDTRDPNQTTAADSSKVTGLFSHGQKQ